NRTARSSTRWSLFPALLKSCATDLLSRFYPSGNSSFLELTNPNYYPLNMNATFFRFGIKTTAGLLLALGLTAPLLAQKKLKAVAVTVGDIGNTFFVQIAHGADARATQYNPAVTFTAEQSNYDVSNRTKQMNNV